MRERGNAQVGLWIALGSITFVLLVTVALAGCPRYNVWEREMAGKAELKQADWNRKIAVREAEAKEESASLPARAEVARAKGVVEANAIIGKSLEGNESYLRYLWIQGLHDGSSEIIYVATEANLPILEATRSNRKQK